MADVLNTNFEPATNWCVLFILSILASINMIDINMCKVVISHKNVLLLCLRFLQGTVTTK